ncbi:MAG: 2Fe-2S iron-sulfur cluster-binding protein [Calditrichota bacterium]
MLPNQVSFQLDGKEITVSAGISVRKAALRSGVYVPGLCSHPELNPFKPFAWSEEVWQGENRFTPVTEAEFPHCNLCQVEINGELTRACTAPVSDGLTVTTTSPRINQVRREALKNILAHHPHACLSCAQAEGCSLTQCSMNVPENERCCELLGRCELGKVADYIGIPPDTPRYQPRRRNSIADEPLFIRDYELCINCLRCVRVCRDVRGVDVLGAVSHQDEIYVGTKKGPHLVDALCRFCGACVEVCPTGALRDKKDTIHLVDGQAPCAAACPLGIDAPGYIELTARGLDREALELIRERAVLPGVLGYACFHPCEDKCRRAALDQPASICALKRYAAEAGRDHSSPPFHSPPAKRGGKEGGDKL